MVVGVVGREPDLTDCLTRVRNETHDRDLGNLRAARVGGVAPLREEQHGSVTMLGEGDRFARSGPLVATAQAQDCIDVPRLVRRRPDEEDRTGHEEDDDDEREHGNQRMPTNEASIDRITRSIVGQGTPIQTIIRSVRTGARPARSLDRVIVAIATLTESCLGTRPCVGHPTRDRGRYRAAATDTGASVEGLDRLFAGDASGALSRAGRMPVAMQTG
jgi:hypothetical protein